MAALLKKKQIRNGHRNHVRKLFAEVNDMNENIVRTNVIRQSLLNKQTVLKTLDDEILEIIVDEEEIADEISEASNLGDSLFEHLSKLQNYIDKSKNEDSSSLVSSNRGTKSLKLPKITIPKFGGSPLARRGFWQ